MAMRVLKAAFIGAGNVNFGHPSASWDHASRLEEIDNISVVAIVDIDTDKAVSVLQTRSNGQHGDMYKTCKVYGSVDHLLQSDTRPNVVFVGTPPITKGSLGDGKDIELKCIKAGIHVFTEKPISLERMDKFTEYSIAMAEAEVASNVVVSVGYMFRYHSAVEKMKQLIMNHGGKVMALNGKYSNALKPGKALNPFWWNKDLSGGPIVEQATHLLDLARYVAGEVDLDSVQTTTLQHHDSGGAGVLSHGPDVHIPDAQKIPRVTATQWRFKDGGVGSFLHTTCLYGRKYEVSFEVYMDGLRMTLEDPYLETCRLKVRDSKSDEDTVFEFGDCDPYMKEIAAFIDAVRTGNKSGIRSPYQDASQTYEFTRRIDSAETRS